MSEWVVSKAEKVGNKILGNKHGNKQIRGMFEKLQSIRDSGSSDAEILIRKAEGGFISTARMTC